MMRDYFLTSLTKIMSQSYSNGIVELNNKYRGLNADNLLFAKYRFN